MSGAPSASLRPLGLPRPLEVRAAPDGMPLAVARRGRASRDARRVEGVEEVWRVAEEWWRASAQARTYYRVLLEGGQPLTLFHDDATGAWFEQPYTHPEGERRTEAHA